MANEIQELLNDVKDERLRARLSAAVAELRRAKSFGLVFERHLPELLPIYSAKIRAQARVARRGRKLSDTFVVQELVKGVATVTPEGGGAAQEIPAADLVVVKRFGEAIFPALRHVDTLLRGGDAPHHTLIEADNYHALQLLDWLYAGKVDCIYIDPPYNSGARDWKYNNDYVDSNDSWRHSKWLAFIERRLKLARRLLRRDSGVLIVTIDEREYLHLGMLLEQIFPDARIQMVSTMINPAVVARAGGFGRSDEYIFFVLLGDAAPERLTLGREWVSEKGRTHTGNVRWDLLRRSGTNAARSDRRKLFYPIYISNSDDGPRIARVGSALPDGTSVAPAVKGLTPVLPIRKNGTEGNWQWEPETLRERIAHGRVRVGGNAERGFVIYILKDGEFAKIQRGEFREIGRAADGSIIVEKNDPSSVRAVPGSQWRIASHDATQYGSRLLSDVLPGQKFPFPKSVYAVRDALRFFVESKPDALVLDFFCGSGTTLNAVNLLNAADGGRRRCVVVTNNEVSADEAEALTSRGLQPGHDHWEQLGICRSVTWPRSKATILGRRDTGEELPGEYFTGRFEEQELQRKICGLDFAPPALLGKKAIRESLAFALGFPKSKLSPDDPFFLAEGEKVAALLDPAAFDDFVELGQEWADSIETVYLSSESGRAFRDMKSQLLEAWPARSKTVEIKRPMRDGFSANVDYFRLDFLDRAVVETGGKLSDILPALWMMAGCRGKLPKCKDAEKMLFFKECPFAVLVDESAIKPFLAKLEQRVDVDWVFLVTNDQDSFSRMCEWLPSHIPASQRVHLWRNYLDNFIINVELASIGRMP